MVGDENDVVNSGDAEAAAVFSGAGLVRRSSAFGLSVPAVGGGESVGDPKLLPLVTVTVGSTVPTVSPFAFVYDVLSGDDGTILPSPGPLALLIFNGIIFANPGESGDRGDPPTFDCPHELERIGAVGDGGKWICGLSRIEDKPDCVIYTFGTFLLVQSYGYHRKLQLSCEPNTLLT